MGAFLLLPMCSVPDSQPPQVHLTIETLMAYLRCRGLEIRYEGTELTQWEAIWVLVLCPYLRSTSEHFYTYFPFGSCTGPGAIPMHWEYTIMSMTTDFLDPKTILHRHKRKHKFFLHKRTKRIIPLLEIYLKMPLGDYRIGSIVPRIVVIVVNRN